MNCPRAVVLVGPRGAGKTTVGRRLATRLGWEFRDGDELLAESAGVPAGVYLARAGEPAFRQLEERVTLEALCAPGPRVLALGGGAVLSAAVRQRLRHPAFFTVFLTAPPAVLASRLAADPAPRPPLTALGPAEEAAAVLLARHPLYREVSAVAWDTDRHDLDAVVDGIASAVRGPPS